MVAPNCLPWENLIPYFSEITGLSASEPWSPKSSRTVFIVDNAIQQDLTGRLIHIHDKKYTVQETDPIVLLPIKPVLQSNTIEEIKYEDL